MRTNSFYTRLRLLLGQAAPVRRSREQFSDADVALALLWAEHHRRPTSWGCRRSSYPPAAAFVPPSPSTLSRRGRCERVLGLIESLRARLAESMAPVPLKLIDSRPLLVGGASGDPDARRGRAVGHMARGYRLATIVCGGVVRTWTIDPLNVNDQVLADRLVGTLAQPWAGGWGYVVGDNGFDGNPLYAKAAEYNHLWVAPPRQENRNLRDARRNTPERIRALDHSDNPLRHAGVDRTFGAGLLRERKQVERVFGHSAQLGLGPLPPWVRTLARVRRHVTCQLLLLALRQTEIRDQKAA